LFDKQTVLEQRIVPTFSVMPFVNHDSDKNFAIEFFFTKFQRKNIEFTEKLGKIRKAFSKKSDFTVGPEFFI
jgi:hypothetical protein